MKPREQEVTQAPVRMRQAIHKKLPRGCGYLLVITDGTTHSLDGTIMPQHLPSILRELADSLETGNGVLASQVDVFVPESPERPS